MRIAHIAVAFLLLSACSSKVPPVPKQTPESGSSTGSSAPPTATVMTKEECEAQGGRVNSSMGGGDQAHCADGETELAPVRLGIEGGWCCKTKP